MEAASGAARATDVRLLSFGFEGDTADITGPLGFESSPSLTCAMALSLALQDSTTSGAGEDTTIGGRTSFTATGAGRPETTI
jgi:hypothetical protein